MFDLFRNLGWRNRAGLFSTRMRADARRRPLFRAPRDRVYSLRASPALRRTAITLRSHVSLRKTARTAATTMAALARLRTALILLACIAIAAVWASLFVRERHQIINVEKIWSQPIP